MVKGHVIRALSWILGMSYSVIDGLVIITSAGWYFDESCLLVHLFVGMFVIVHRCRSSLDFWVAGHFCRKIYV